jgi:hypothetical protein
VRIFVAPIAVLLALLTWECLPMSAEPALPPQAIVRTARPTPPDAPPVSAWTGIVLARPLFAPDRRPAASGPAAAQESLPRLTGTIRSDDRMLAIFAAPGSTPNAAGKSVVVERSGTIAGWNIADITDGEVTLQRGGRSAILHISFINAPAAAPSGAPKLVLLHDWRASPFLQP